MAAQGNLAEFLKSDNSACSISARPRDFPKQVFSRRMLTLAIRAATFTTYYQVDGDETSDDEYEGLEWVCGR